MANWGKGHTRLIGALPSMHTNAIIGKQTGVITVADTNQISRSRKTKQGS